MFVSFLAVGQSPLKTEVFRVVKTNSGKEAGGPSSGQVSRAPGRTLRFWGPRSRPPSSSPRRTAPASHQTCQTGNLESRELIRQTAMRVDVEVNLDDGLVVRQVFGGWAVVGLSVDVGQTDVGQTSRDRGAVPDVGQVLTYVPVPVPWDKRFCPGLSRVVPCSFNEAVAIVISPLGRY